MSAQTLSEKHRDETVRAFRANPDMAATAGVLAGIADFLAERYGPRIAAEMFYSHADELCVRRDAWPGPTP